MSRRPVFFMLAMTAACQGPGAVSNDVVRDSAGIAVLDVAPSSRAAEMPFVLAQAPLAATQPDFGDIADVALASNGSFVVLDPLAAEVVVLDSTGLELARFGGEGTGPGELRGNGLSDVVAIADSVFVPDIVNGRLTVFGLGGELIRTEPLDVSVGLLLDWRAAHDGGLLARRVRQPERIERLLDGRRDVVMTFDGVQAPTAPGPLGSIPVWCVFPDGRRAVGRTPAYDISIFEGAERRAIVRSPSPPRPVTESEVEHVQELMLQAMQSIPRDQVSPELVERMMAGVVFPESVPEIGGLACPTNEELWIQRASLVTEMGQGVLRVGSARAFGGPTWDVWNVETGELRAVTVGGSGRVTRVLDTLLVGFTVNELGVKQAARWHVR